MEQVVNALQWPVLMDVLAVGTSLILIGWLIFNRIRYGHLLLSPRAATADFTSAMTRQMMAQQSLRSYQKIHKTLQQEFDRLQHLTSGDPHGGPQGEMPEDAEGRRSAIPPMSLQRSQCYNRAVNMIQKGVEPQEVAQCCGLALSEINLIDYMQKTHH